MVKLLFNYMNSLVLDCPLINVKGDCSPSLCLIGPVKAMSVIRITHLLSIEHMNHHHESKEIIINPMQIPVGITNKLLLTFRVYIGDIPILYSFFSSQSPLSNQVNHLSPNQFHDDRLCLHSLSANNKSSTQIPLGCIASNKRSTNFNINIIWRHSMRRYCMTFRWHIIDNNSAINSHISKSETNYTKPISIRNNCCDAYHALSSSCECWSDW